MGGVPTDASTERLGLIVGIRTSRCGRAELFAERLADRGESLTGGSPMGSLFQADSQLTRSRTMARLGNNPEEFRRRAAECRDLAETCLTAEAERILVELAVDLDREAAQLEGSAALPRAVEANVGA
jgi:hypothetical protein